MLKKLTEIHAVLTQVKAQVERALTQEVLTLRFGWEFEWYLHHDGKETQHLGLIDLPPLMYLDGGKPGHQLSWGLRFYTLRHAGTELRAVELLTPRKWEFPDVWFVPTGQVRRLYRYLLRRQRRAKREQPPIMPPGEQQSLWDNTIGVLKRDQRLLRQYRITQKRGVLLLGSPGNGKTMACRWLRYEALRRGLAWNQVTSEEFQAARSNGSIRDLFSLDEPGVILFDDFDMALRDRQRYGDEGQSTFLTEMDGMHPKHGVIYLFTSNLNLDELDPAAKRPGRLDQILHFNNPTAELRRRFVRETWPAPLLEKFDWERVVADSHGWSFAEMEEARKSAVIRWLETGQVDWSPTLAKMQARFSQEPLRRPVGFATGNHGVVGEIIGPAAQMTSIYK